jgi:isopentenyl-diphosphate Delta-isomerase
MIEQIVFVNEDGTPTGQVGPKLASHTSDTKLHLAFSCYILRRSDNKLLVTQRALAKKVWPGVWTNSVCGHPAPGEAIEDAVRRRASYELGIENLEDLRCIVPKYVYKTPPFNGIIEHEFCPIFVAYTTDEPNPNLEEVEAFKWMDWPAYASMLHNEPDKMSYWAKDQYRLLKRVGPFAILET